MPDIVYDLNVSTHRLTLSSEGLQDIVIDLDAAELTVWQGTDRYQVIAPGGGHWETSAPAGVSDHPGGFETSSGHLLVHNLED